MPEEYDHDELCPALHKELVNVYDCTFCRLIMAVERRERARQWPDPFDKYMRDVEGMPE